MAPGQFRHEYRPLIVAARWSLLSKKSPYSQGCCKIGKTTLACGSAEGDSPLPEREVSSLHPSFPPPQAAKQRVCNSPAFFLYSLTINPHFVYRIIRVSQ